MIFLFSSTIGRSLYLQDVFNVLALPHSALYHFRYDVHWVAQELYPPNREEKEELKQYSENLDGYKGKQAVVVLVDQPEESVERTDEKIKFYPVRRAIIKSIELDGSILHVYFQVKNYVNWYWGEENLDNILAVYNDNLRKVLEVGQRPPSKYISESQKFSSNDIRFADVENSAEGWEHIVKALNQIPACKNVIYYRLSDFLIIKTSWWPRGLGFAEKANLYQQVKEGFSTQQYKQVQIEEILPGRSGYRIKSDQISLLRLSFYQPEEWGRTLIGSSIIATVDKSYFLFIPSPIQVNFRYDKRTISLVPTSINQELFTPIEIGLQEKPENKPASEDGLELPVLAPKIRLLLKLTYPKGGLVTGFIVLLIAQLMIAVSASGIPELFEGWLANWLSPQQIEQVVGLIPLLPIIGSILTTVTLFLLFRRLPGTK